MLYQIESIKTNKNRKLVIIYIIILLLVLAVAIGFGIFMAQRVHNDRQDANQNYNEIKENDNDARDNMQAKMRFVKNIDNIYDGEEGRRVFLTFDDGPSTSVTPYILDTLKKYDIKATFFVLGNRVKDNMDLVKREYDEGHYIANHGYSHKYSKIYASSNNVIKEYNKTENEIQKALEKPEYSSNLFRFPGGSVGGPYDKIKRKTAKILKEKGIAYLDWDALTNDSDGANTKEAIMKNLKETVGSKNNVVLLMHDAPDKILTYETLENVIKFLKEKGYTFKNMYDLINMEE